MRAERAPSSEGSLGQPSGAKMRPPAPEGDRAMAGYHAICPSAKEDQI